ncbi:MAG: hypothetical protein V3T17_06710 [Pseudomonadales bacterium]
MPRSLDPAVKPRDDGGVGEPQDDSEKPGQTTVISTLLLKWASQACLEKPA